MLQIQKLPKTSSNQFQAPQLPTTTNIKPQKATVKDKILLGVYDLVTAVKTAKISYASNNGTMLPGYLGSSGFLRKRPNKWWFCTNTRFCFW